MNIAEIRGGEYYEKSSYVPLGFDSCYDRIFNFMRQIWKL